jgi:hypothetical protein
MATTFTIQRLAQLLAFHENAAASIRATMALLRGDTPARPGPKPSPNGAPPTLAKAVALDAKRRAVARLAKRAQRARRKPGPKPKRAPSTHHGYAKRVLKQRQRTADALARFDDRDPRIPSDVGANTRSIGVLVRRGYLTRKAGGYVRTGKPFHVKSAPDDATAKAS